MVEVWFGLLCLTLTMFAVLDGWNIGAGALHYLAGKTNSERREIVAALGPLWSWHEVWLLAFGGTFLLAFPKIMATSFAGFYLALWLVLWSFILRGVSLEVGATSRTGSGSPGGTSSSPSRARCSPCCLAPRSAT